MHLYAGASERTGQGQKRIDLDHRDSTVFNSSYNGLMTKFFVPRRLLKLYRRMSLCNALRSKNWDISGFGSFCVRWPCCCRLYFRWSVDCAFAKMLNESTLQLSSSSASLIPYRCAQKRFRMPYDRTEHTDCERLTSTYWCANDNVDDFKRNVEGVGECAKRYLYWILSLLRLKILSKSLTLSPPLLSISSKSSRRSTPALNFVFVSSSSSISSMERCKFKSPHVFWALEPDAAFASFI